MKKFLVPCLAVVAIVAIIFCFVFNGQKGDLQKKLDEANAKVTELEGQVKEAQAALETVKTETEAKIAELQQQMTEAANAAVAAATEAATGAAAATEGAAAPAEEAAVMSHADFIAAAVDSPVVVESYVQAHQSWWDNKVTVYLQDADGAYFVYELACSEEDAAKLVPGQKIRVKGYKSEWSGEVEITDGSFEFVEGDSFIATAEDVTALLDKDELVNHMNEFVAVKGATIVAQEDGNAFAYKNPEEKTDDLYFAVDVGGKTYNFCVEFYLCGKDTDVYKAVEGLKVGDVVDIEGFLYWYNGANLQATSLTVTSAAQ